MAMANTNKNGGDLLTGYSLIIYDIPKRKCNPAKQLREMGALHSQRSYWIVPTANIPWNVIKLIQEVGGIVDVVTQVTPEQQENARRIAERAFLDLVSSLGTRTKSAIERAQKRLENAKKLEAELASKEADKAVIALRAMIKRIESDIRNAQEALLLFGFDKSKENALRLAKETVGAELESILPALTKKAIGKFLNDNDNEPEYPELNEPEFDENEPDIPNEFLEELDDGEFDDDEEFIDVEKENSIDKENPVTDSKQKEQDLLNAFLGL